MKSIDYYSRVLPVIGDTFLNQTVAFWGLDFTHQIAECLARDGMKSFVFVDSKTVKDGDAMVFSYGVAAAGQDQGQFLTGEFQKRNPVNDSKWEIIDVDTFDNDNLSHDLKDVYGVDLIVAGGSQADCLNAFRVSKETGIPAVIFALHSDLTFHSTILISHPEMTSLDSVMSEICKSDVIGKNEFANRMNFLRASDLAMNFVNALLLRDSKFKNAAFEKIFFEQGRNVVLYGKVSWPWWVQYINPAVNTQYLSGCFSTGLYLGNTPGRSSLKDKSVLVIGCGTSSLLLAELVYYFKNVYMIDYKPFSPFNAVRQLPNASEVESDLVKPFLLQEILTNRIGGFWASFSERYGEVFVNSEMNRHFVAMNLKLQDYSEESKRAFESLVDDLQPDIVVVAMGRTHDDNFTACRILREMNVKHVVPAVYPGAIAHRVVVVDGARGLCYECHNHRLSIDSTHVSATDLNQDIAEFREMFYKYPDDPTDPATIAETWPSVHTTLELTLQLCSSEELRSAWFDQCMRQDKISFVGGVKVSSTLNGDGSFGVSYPGQVVVFGNDDVISQGEKYVCRCCGRTSE